MSDPRFVPGAPALLFERLTDLAPEVDTEPQPLRMLTPAALRQSVARELDRLLNTRAPVAADILSARARSTIDYGIPDLSLFGLRDFDSETRLAQTIRQAIEIYEPRLRNPQVRLERNAQQNGALVIHVDGELQVGPMIEPISFAVAIQGGSEHHGE